MTDAQAKAFRFNPFDLTKVWPKAEYPLIEVGVMELNRWPDNYFAEVEQAAFGPSNVVPGISFSPDRMLQARLFAYPDAVLYRLGVNYYQIPVYAPMRSTAPASLAPLDSKSRILCLNSNSLRPSNRSPLAGGTIRPPLAKRPIPATGSPMRWASRIHLNEWENDSKIRQQVCER